MGVFRISMSLVGRELKGEKQKIPRNGGSGRRWRLAGFMTSPLSPPTNDIAPMTPTTPTTQGDRARGYKDAHHAPDTIARPSMPVTKRPTHSKICFHEGRLSRESAWLVRPGRC